MSQAPRHYLVTGGAGFLGSLLVARLMENTLSKVTVIDDLSTGNLRNIAKFQSNPNFRFIKADIIDTHAFDDYNLDPHIKNDTTQLIFTHIYHLACPASPPAYMKDPIHTLQTCFDGTLNILRIAKLHGARVLFTSTSEIYGDPLITPQKETYWGNVNSFGPRSCYDEGKRAAESLCFNFINQGLKIHIARLFNSYGPNMNPDDGRVVSNMIVSALQKKPLSIYGEGKQTRSFTYGGDTVQGLISLMESEYYLPVNIGNPGGYKTINEFAEIIWKKVNKDSPLKIQHIDAVTDDPQERKPDISRAKTEIGWEPKVELEEGLEITIKYFADIVHPPKTEKLRPVLLKDI